MTTRPDLFVSLFAGSWPEGLALIGGLRLGPVVSYMGSKRNLLPPILGAMGLQPGAGAGSYLLCDAGPWGWVWQALTRPPVARAVATVLRGWRNEDPTELWTRLAATDPPRDLVRLAATVLWLQARTASNCPLIRRRGRWRMGDRPRAGGLRALTQKGTGWGKRSGLVSTVTAARRVEAIAEGVARYLALQAGSARARPIGIRAGRWRTEGYGHLSNLARSRRFKDRLRPELVGARVERLASVPWPRMRVVHADVEIAMELLRSRADLRGVVVYLDPPYMGCTSYAAACSRARVIAIARELSERGALVCISEAEPLTELAGWDTMDITASRIGHKGKSKAEWLTSNRSFVERVSVQVPMSFGQVA